MVEANSDASEGLIYINRNVECVGPYYIQYLTNKDNEFDSRSDDLSNSTDKSDESFVINPNDDLFLRSLDPKEWKKQDHYQVLGLESLRFKASPAIIKSAYRQKVLKHHPDKRKAKGEHVNRDEDYFTCITKAWETLGDPVKRKSYDSIDPYFDDAIPSNSDVKKKEFFNLFTDYFSNNARWSEKKPVPLLGGPEDDSKKIDEFYSFWYNFVSWREFSYEDEEAKESGQDREERRWIDKQNKVVRAKKKKEEMSRIRNLVDLAYNADPRVKKYILEEKEKKLMAKKLKYEAIRAGIEETQRLQREAEEARAKEKAEADAKEAEKRKALKAERDAEKKALQIARKTLRDLCKENSYYITEQKHLEKNVEFCEKICEMVGSIEINEFTNKLKQGGREAFYFKLNEFNKKCNQDMMYTRQPKQTNGVKNSSKPEPWSSAEINLLIKGVNLFPVGTSQRWEVIANFMNNHNSNTKKTVTAKEVLAKAKELKDNNETNQKLKQVVNQKAFDLYENHKKVPGSVEVVASERFEEAVVESAVWTAEEQKLLEQALKTYPSSVEDRWDKIAECLPSRTKKDCMKRYKDLVQMIKAKKEAEKMLKK